MEHQEHTLMNEDIFAYELALKMLTHASPFGHILDILYQLCGTVHDVEGFAAFALDTININPKHALNPAFAFLAATPAWRHIQPQLAAELREKGIRAAQGFNAAPRPLRKRHPGGPRLQCCPAPPFPKKKFLH
jgi:hypothetical protein